MHGLEYRDDEIFYYKSTQEMIRSGNVLSPTYFGEDRFQKPIFFYWLMILSYKVFGTNWFGARFISVLFAGLSVCFTWLIGKNLFNRKVATLSAIILMTVPLFFRHAKNAVPDMTLNFFIVAALFYAVRFIQISFGTYDGGLQKKSKQAQYGMLFFVFCALGFMVKGFTAVIIPFLTIILYSAFSKKGKILAEMRFGRGIFIILLIVCPWFFYMISMHGQTYLNYMMVDETKNRLMSGGNSNIVLTIISTFLDHCLFYLSVLSTYFAPWCIFLMGAIPLAFWKIKLNDPAKEGLSLMLVWFFVVFCFFSMIYYSINHYLLVLSTPFAILVSVFLLENFDRQYLVGKIISIMRKYVAIFIFTVGCLAFSFLFVFLAGAGKWWLVVFFLAYIAVIGRLSKSSKPLVAPLSLGILMLLVFAQSSLMTKAGVTSHVILQKFAATINQGIMNDALGEADIGVGSHDIHEKEFQVYFDQRVIKAAGSEEYETKAKLTRLFKTDKRVYCLMTEKDYQYFLKNSYPGTLEVIQEDYIIRRRFNIDKGFFMALLRLDQSTIHHYLKEKLVLVRKKSNA